MQIDGGQVTIGTTERLSPAAYNGLSDIAESMGLKISYKHVEKSFDGNAEYEGRQS